MNNAYVLHKKYGRKKLEHELFMEHIAEYLITKGVPTATCIPKRKHGLAVASNPGQERLTGRHFPSHIPPSASIKRTKPSKLCHACNFGKKDAEKLGHPDAKIPHKLTSFMCSECDQPLCINPCFHVYHTVPDYQKSLLEFRIENL